LGTARALHGHKLLIAHRADALRKLYPGYSLVLSDDLKLNLLAFSGVSAQPLSESQVVNNVFFVPLARRSAGVPGVLIDIIEYGAFKLVWDVR
jgi:transitional endoplasmic reticulum ATPase